MPMELSEMIVNLQAQIANAGSLEIPIAEVDAANISNGMLRSALRECYLPVVQTAEILGVIVSRLHAAGVRLEAIAHLVKDNEIRLEEIAQSVKDNEIKLGELTRSLSDQKGAEPIS